MKEWMGHSHMMSGQSITYSLFRYVASICWGHGAGEECWSSSSSSVYHKLPHSAGLVGGPVPAIATGNSARGFVALSP